MARVDFRNDDPVTSEPPLAPRSKSWARQAAAGLAPISIIRPLEFTEADGMPLVCIHARVVDILEEH
jgi:hypothetical protein